MAVLLDSEDLSPLSVRFFRRDAETVARGLLGRYVVRIHRGAPLVLRIVETEAYLGKGDRASHAWRGHSTPRTESLFRAGGCAYVYLIYGLHNMFNVVVGKEGRGGAVLIRAGEPVVGASKMRRLRSLARSAPEEAVASGPGKLCQALAIDRSYDGADLRHGSLRIGRGRKVAAAQVEVGVRVGVDYAGEAADWPLRFAVAGSRHVSRPGIRSSGT